MQFSMPNVVLKEKQVKTVTLVLGTITTLLVGLLGFRVISDTVFVRAGNFKPKNVAIVDIQKNSARIKWTSDSETQSVVEYGSSPTSLTFFAPEATKTKDHLVELNLLTSGNTYYFQIRTGDKVFDNEGVPWTFTTLDKNSQAATVSPTVNPSGALPSDNPEVTPLPTSATTPEPTTSSSRDQKCDLKEYQNYFGQTNTPLDQDNNGIINFQDWSVCKSKNQGVTVTSPTPIASEEKTISATASLDGYLTKNITSGTIVPSLTNEIQIGKDNSTSSRGFIGFESVPTGITVTQAKLKLYQNRTTGLPFNNNGNLVVDNYLFGTSIDTDDWDKTTADVLLAQNVVTIGAGDSQTWREFDVTSAMQVNATAKRATAEFRLRFSNDGVAGNSTGDYVYFSAADNATYAPQLYLKYQKTS
jgi:hypothetical protein